MARRAPSNKATDIAPQAREQLRALIAAYARDLAKRHVEAAQEENTLIKTRREPEAER
jgi:hypothetical protein